jgi:ABC-2 type transport system permease protein
MSLRRVNAVLLQELFITIHSVEVIMDIFIFPFVNIVVFGFLSLYLRGSDQGNVGQYVLLGMLLWQIIWIIEYSISVGSLWNIWARNLSNMFIAPLMMQEYILAHTLSGTVKACIMVFLGSTLSFFIFHFNLLTIGIIPLILLFINFAFFAFSMGIAMLGLIFRYGTRIQAFAWGVVPIFQPLSAAFYPVSVMPFPLQFIAYLFPPTYTFEAARYSLVYHTINWQLFGLSFAENILYCVICILFFSKMFKKSRDTGQFARNEA